MLNFCFYWLMHELLIKIVSKFKVKKYQYYKMSSAICYSYVAVTNYWIFIKNQSATKFNQS